MKNPHPSSDINLILSILLVSFPTMIRCDKKPVYHEPSKQVFEAGTSLPEDALFGYSITYQTMRKKIMIGAPKADVQGGVFECDTTSNYTCSKLEIKIGYVLMMVRNPSCASPTRTSPEWNSLPASVFPDSYNIGIFKARVNRHDLSLRAHPRQHHYLPSDPKPIANKQFWLGAAACAGSDFFLTCAPGYSSKNVKTGSYRTFSRCFYQSGSGEINKNHIELSDEEKVKSNRYFFSKSRSNFREKRFDTMGWSMDVGTDDVTIVGGPGAAMGRAMLIPKRKLSRPQLVDLKSDYSDPEATVLYNFGYSVKAGKFLGSEVYAISSPYGAMGRGKVLLYSKKLEYILAIVNDDIGSIFGGALCGARLGAGDEALLVGAPASALSAHDEVDVGAVYVYLNETGKMILKRTIRGYQNKGYFGYAIATVGDLNLDDKDEVVISAPYENEYRGTVYIFSGADLVKDATAHIQWLQRIEGDAPAQMLGLALSAVQDLDGNGCNELSIGRPGNNSALLLKCMAFITFTLDLEEKDRYDEMNNTLLLMDMCVKFNYSEKLREIDNYVSTITKIKHPNATLSNSENNTLLHNVSLAESKKACRSLQIILPLNGNYDKEIVLQVNSFLAGQDPRTSNDTKYGLVMLTDETQTYLERKIPVQGSNLRMKLSMTFGEKYIIGSTKSENLTIEVWNEAHSRGGAYTACVRVHITGGGGGVPVARASNHCALAGAGDAVTCVPSGPIYAGKRMISTMTLDTVSLTGEVDFIQIEAKLFKECNGSLTLVNTTTIPLQKDINITVTGESIPSAVVNVYEAEIAFGYENIIHVYAIINSGLTSWEKNYCNISIPQFISYNISTDTHGRECTQDHHKKTATCVLNKLGGNTKRDIIISMEVLPNTQFTDEVLTGKAELATELTCMIAGKNRIKRITTTMKLLRTAVPMWILVIAVAIGLLAVLIMTFVLYECGFLRRRHKEELTALKRDVKRQSIRRSIRLSESRTEESKQQLLESNTEADETASVVTVDVAETLHDQSDSGSRRVVADIQHIIRCRTITPNLLIEQ